MRSSSLRMLMVVAGSVLSLLSPALARQSRSAAAPLRSRPTITVAVTMAAAPSTTGAPPGGSGPGPTVERPPLPLGQAARAVAFALAQLGKPYRFGAVGPAAFDCSGLTRAAYLSVGIGLPHYAAYQAKLGLTVAWAAAGVRPGDLVFVRGGRPRHDLGHVGIAVTATDWVQAPAPGQVVRRGSIPFDRVQAVRRIVAG